MFLDDKLDHEYIISSISFMFELI